jgi:hypothetical protein
MNSKLDFTKCIMAGLYAAIISVALNAMLFFILVMTEVITNDVLINGEKLTYVPVIISSGVSSLVASVVFFLFEQFTDRGFRYFSIFAFILFVASLFSPFLSIPNVPMKYALGLNAMHLVVYAAITIFIMQAGEIENE